MRPESPALRVRPELPGEAGRIRAIHDAAFGGTDEGTIVDALRDTPEWLPDLSLVADLGNEHDGALVGHCLVSRGRLERADGTAASVLVLGPIAVHPDHQGRGIGSALMRAAIGRAVGRAEPIIALLGHEGYYARFGFAPARDLGIEPPAPWPDGAWMALRLPAWTPDLRGVVRYPPAFGAP